MGSEANKIGLNRSTLRRGGEFKHEATKTFHADSSFRVTTRRVDWKEIRLPFRFNYPFSQPDSLIKFSEERYSPVSDLPSDYIQLGSPSYYQSLSVKGNSEMTVDENECAYTEELRQKEKGSEFMERLKENSMWRHVSLKVKWKLQAPWLSLLYSTSIDPKTSHQRRGLLDNFPSSYNFMTKINYPPSFAINLGRDFAKQLALSDDPRWEARANYEIFVEHGPVIYLEEIEIERAMRDLLYEQRGYILPFVKRRMYQEQKEYRFIIRALIPSKVYAKDELTDTVLLRVSDELRNLMVPISEWWLKDTRDRLGQFA